MFLSHVDTARCHVTRVRMRAVVIVGEVFPDAAGFQGRRTCIRTMSCISACRDRQGVCRANGQSFLYSVALLWILCLEVMTLCIIFYL